MLIRAVQYCSLLSMKFWPTFYILVYNLPWYATDLRSTLVLTGKFWRLQGHDRHTMRFNKQVGFRINNILKKYFYEDYRKRFLLVWAVCCLSCFVWDKYFYEIHEHGYIAQNINLVLKIFWNHIKLIFGYILNRLI